MHACIRWQHSSPWHQYRRQILQSHRSHTLQTLHHAMIWVDSFLVLALPPNPRQKPQQQRQHVSLRRRTATFVASVAGICCRPCHLRWGMAVAGICCKPRHTRSDMAVAYEASAVAARCGWEKVGRPRGKSAVRRHFGRRSTDVCRSVSCLRWLSQRWGWRWTGVL